MVKNKFSYWIGQQVSYFGGGTCFYLGQSAEKHFWYLCKDGRSMDRQKFQVGFPGNRSPLTDDDKEPIVLPKNILSNYCALVLEGVITE